MTETELTAQVRTMLALIAQNYQREAWLCLPDTLDADRRTMAKFQIHLGAVFGSTKDERDARLETLAALLPIRQHTSAPIDLTTTKRLLLAELYGLLTWLEANDAAVRTLRTIRKDPTRWAQLIRANCGYLYRPVLPQPPIDDLPMFGG